MSQVKETYVPWIPKAEPDLSYPFAYNFVLINSIEELNQSLNIEYKDCNEIGFDTETTRIKS